ncbi:NADP-dependent oxidoreductase domain-containing protein [Mycena olivaceomarginata]|nr:NADP-dependent oxidoreductase domain-containing protein [Mycena olivaceomarginata]
MSNKPVSNVGVVFGAMLIGTGTMEAIRVTTQEATTELLDLFQKHGHSEVDTARIYTNGTSEEMLGAISWQVRLLQLFPSAGIKMDTKLFPTKGKNMGWLTREEWTHSPADLRKGLGNSLAALKASKLHIFYLHAPDRSVPYEDTLREVNKLHTEGLFERFGLSNYPAWEVAQICEISKRNGWVLPSVYQGLYNAHQRVVEAELIPCLRAYGISFYVYSPLAGGFLTSRYTQDQTTFEAGDRFDPARPFAALSRGRNWNEPSFKALDALRPKELGDAVIIGASSKKRLEENLEALNKGPLPADVVAALDEGWKKTRVLPFSYSH